MKVLVVDDDSSIRLLVKAMLQELGHEAIVAGGGVELCRRIRARVSPEYTYVILLTALDAQSHYLTAIDAGVDDFLTKPFDPDLMAARLRVAERILGLRRHADQLERLLPICMYCKKIRDGEEWVSVEEFLGRETSRQVTHGICAHCYDNVARPAIKRILKEQG